MSDKTVTVHDTAYMQEPHPAAVSRVTLNLWCLTRHPKTPRFLHSQPALVECMCDALTWITEEAPDFAHGMLVHGIQRYEGGPAMEPVINTLRQYASSRTALGATLITAPTGWQQSGDPEFQYAHILLYDQRKGSKVAKWAWHTLAGTLLYGVHSVGQPPRDIPTPNP